MKYLTIDIVTTGDDIFKNQIIEIGAVIDDLSKPIPIDEIPKFHYYIDNHMINGTPDKLLSLHKQLIIISEKKDKYPIINSSEVIDFFHNWLIDNSVILSQCPMYTLAIDGHKKINFLYRDLLNTKCDFKKDYYYDIFNPMILFCDPKNQKIPTVNETLLETKNYKKRKNNNILDNVYDIVRLMRFKFLCPTIQTMLCLEKGKSKCNICDKEFEYCMDTDKDSILRRLCSGCICDRILG